MLIPEETQVHLYCGITDMRKSINTLAILLLIREHCARHANRLSIWLLMGSLPSESEITFIDGACGGQKLQQLGNIRNFCNILLMCAGTRKQPPMRLRFQAFTLKN